MTNGLSSVEIRSGVALTDQKIWDVVDTLRAEMGWVSPNDIVTVYKADLASVPEPVLE